jgi:hypothetical protein
MARGKWWSGELASQRNQMLNFRTKIGAYQPILNLTAAQITAWQNLADSFMQAYDFAEQVEATAEAATKWRNEIFRGEPKGSAAPDPPVFAVGTPVISGLGVVSQFFEVREQIVANPAFTEAIGEDLMLLGPIKDDTAEGEVAPSLKLSTRNGYRIEIAGSMKGYPQMRVEWRAKGQNNWELMAFLTKLPAEIVITPGTPGDPQSGELRAVYFRDNAQYGVYSPNYPLTVTE